jgi:beta-phosphoglucomutase-like phosphatase (HAD superfamily)
MEKIDLSLSLSVEPRDCLVVEDSLPGIRAGLAAGMTVFAFQPHGMDLDVPSGTIPLAGLIEIRDRIVSGAART